jgi:hypothetical protein
MPNRLIVSGLHGSRSSNELGYLDESRASEPRKSIKHLAEMLVSIRSKAFCLFVLMQEIAYDG